MIQRVDPVHPDAAVLADAAARLRAGELVAFPTETVYGLGAHALDVAAVERIFEAKGRPAFNPLIVHVPDVAAARALATAWPEAAQRLAEAFWPGPLTVVVPKGPQVPDRVTAGRGSVAIRIPAHPVALALLRAVGLPLAAPSANRFTEVSPTTAQHVARGLGQRVGLILDGGATDVGIESTVVDCTTDPPTLLRPGMVSRAQLEAVVGPVALASAPETAEAPRAGPGMVDRHYAPRATVELVSSADLPVALARYAQLADGGTKVAVILRTPVAEDSPFGNRRSSLGNRPPSLVSVLGPSPAAYARALYAALHAADEAGCERMLIEAPPDDSAWDGVRDRLRRASHPG